LLHESTKIIIENHYLGSILQKGQFDTFYHEHPRTYSYQSFKFVAKAFGLDVVYNKNWMTFRAFLGSFSDSYSGAINSQQYVGRGENFYTYQGFTRKISLSWTVAALSKEELIPMYKKLSYLASNTAPVYNDGFMQGPLIQLTVGGYIHNMPGYIEGLTLEMGEDSTWEIGINDSGLRDPTVAQLTHIIKVSGFSFTPIIAPTSIPALRPSTLPSVFTNGPEIDRRIYSSNNQQSYQRRLIRDSPHGRLPFIDSQWQKSRSRYQQGVINEHATVGTFRSMDHACSFHVQRRARRIGKGSSPAHWGI
jgi:hypothetical protein